jgi:hypothetical protein
MTPPNLRRKISALFAVVLLTCILAAGATTASARRHPVSGIAAVRLGTTARTGAQHLPRYAYVVLGRGDYRYARSVKRSSPMTKVLAYETGMDLVDDCLPATWLCPSITYQEAQAHDTRHPRDPWILRDGAGRSLVNPNYPHSHLANVGSVTFQRAWVRRVAAANARGGFDGVLVDNVLGLLVGWSGGRYPTLYPSDAAWEGAMIRFVRAVGPALKKRGLYVVISAFKGQSNDGSADVAFWRKLAPSVSGLMAEYWEQSPLDLRPYDANPSTWTGQWVAWLRLADTAQRAGADFFPLQYASSSDVRTMTYGKASFLLVWDGAGGGYSFSPTSGADPWNPAWTTSIGKPVGRRYRVGTGWRRNFTRGTVVVNPDPTHRQVFALRGRYTRSDGAEVASVALAPVNAMILRRAR